MQRSLNLVGQTAANICTEAISFFGVVQKLFNFVSASTHRWNKLKDQISLNYLENNRLSLLKSLSDTRWSARFDAIRSLKINYISIIQFLKILAEDMEQSCDTRSEAANLLYKLCEIESCILCVLWYNILERINHTKRGCGSF